MTIFNWQKYTTMDLTIHVVSKIEMHSNINFDGIVSEQLKVITFVFELLTQPSSINLFNVLIPFRLYFICWIQF